MRGLQQGEGEGPLPIQVHQTCSALIRSILIRDQPGASRPVSIITVMLDPSRFARLILSLYKSVQNMYPSLNNNNNNNNNNIMWQSHDKQVGLTRSGSRWQRHTGGGRLVSHAGHHPDWLCGCRHGYQTGSQPQALHVILYAQWSCKSIDHGPTPIASCMPIWRIHTTSSPPVALHSPELGRRCPNNEIPHQNNITIISPFFVPCVSEENLAPLWHPLGRTLSSHLWPCTLQSWSGDSPPHRSMCNCPRCCCTAENSCQGGHTRSYLEEKVGAKFFFA